MQSFARPGARADETLTGITKCVLVVDIADWPVAWYPFAAQCHWGPAVWASFIGQLADELETHGEEHHREDGLAAAGSAAVDIAVNEEAAAEDLHTLALVTELHRRLKTQATQKLLDEVRALKVRRCQCGGLPCVGLLEKIRCARASFLPTVFVFFWCHGSRTRKIAHLKLGLQLHRTIVEWLHGQRLRSTTLKWSTLSHAIELLATVVSETASRPCEGTSLHIKAA